MDTRDRQFIMSDRMSSRYSIQSTKASTRGRYKSMRKLSYGVFSVVLIVSVSLTVYFSTASDSTSAAGKSRDKREVNGALWKMFINGMMGHPSTTTTAPSSTSTTKLAGDSNKTLNAEKVINSILDGGASLELTLTTTAPPIAKQSPKTTKASIIKQFNEFDPHITHPTVLPLARTTTRGPLTGDCTHDDFIIDGLCVLPYQIKQMQMKRISYMGLLESVRNMTLCDHWKNCQTGTWCAPTKHLQEVVYSMAQRWTNGNYNAQVCPLRQCLRQVTQQKGCSNPTRVYMIEGAALMCDLSQSFMMKKESDLVCAATTLYMMNMDLGEMMGNSPVQMKNHCDYQRLGATVCNFEACRVYFAKMVCLAKLCGSERGALSMFPPWAGFFTYYYDVVKTCKIPSTTCTADDIIQDPNAKVTTTTQKPAVTTENTTVAMVTTLPGIKKEHNFTKFVKASSDNSTDKSTAGVKKVSIDDDQRREDAKKKDEEANKKNYYIHYITAHIKDDKRVVGGIVLAGVIGCVIIIISMLAIIRRIRRYREYKRDYMNYSEVRGLMVNENT